MSQSRIKRQSRKPMKQRVEWDKQAVQETLVSPILVDRLTNECVKSGYPPNVGVNSLMTTAGEIVRQCFYDGPEAAEIFRRHLKAAADEMEDLLAESFAGSAPGEMVN